MCRSSCQRGAASWTLVADEGERTLNPNMDVLRLLSFASVFVGLGEGVYEIEYISLALSTVNDKDACVLCSLTLSRSLLGHNGIAWTAWSTGRRSERSVRGGCTNRRS